MSLIAVTARIHALYGDFSGRSDTRFRPCCLALDKSWISSRWAGWDPKGQRCQSKARQSLTGGLVVACAG